MALDKSDKPPAFPKGQFLQIFLLFAAVFIVLDPRIRKLLAGIVGTVLEPLIGFGGHYPILTILLAALIMIAATSFVRHWLVDWLHMARVQNTMRAFQKAMRDARAARDTKRTEQLQKFQTTKLIGLQTELSTNQMKPMMYTMFIVLPIFAWLLEFITRQPYHFFSAPWNPTVTMFTTEGILFGSSVFPHWILFYSAISIPFGSILQKLLKYWTWREHWHLIGPQSGLTDDSNPPSP